MGLLKKLYNSVLRNHLPKKIGMRNGVAVRDRRLFDRTDVQEDWKDGTIESVRRAVSTGDTVVEIGSGYGVCTVVAARQSYPSGKVISYEAASEYTKITRETVHLNSVEDATTVHHAIVGDPVDVWGEESLEVVDPTALPNADVLVLDCEGGELSIINALVDPPETIVVETHGAHEAPTDTVTEALSQHGYEVETICNAGSKGDILEDNDVVTAHRS